MSMPSSLIKKYILRNVPIEGPNKSYGEQLQHAMYKWTKRYWRSLNATARGEFRKDLENNRINVLSRLPARVGSADGSIFLDWSEPVPKINRRKHGRCSSYKRYYGRSGKDVANRLDIERLNKSAAKVKQKKMIKKARKEQETGLS